MDSDTTRMMDDQASRDWIEREFIVSRETLDRLAIYVELVRRWQKSQNLVSPTTLPTIWTRHVADSLQTLALIPQALRWIDFGSGAGFPGLVTAIALTGRPAAMVHLVESNKGKAAFLRTVARETGAPVTVHAERIDVFNERFHDPVDGISARALAPLNALADHSAIHVKRGAVAVFHKGRDFEVELAEASARWSLDLVKHPSRVDAGGCLVEIRRIDSKPTI